MYQTAYSALQSIGRVRVPYVGGFCRWWYTPIQNIAQIAAVNPLTQMLPGEPTLKTGKSWYGPVNVPDSHLGWDEDLQQAKAGHWYKENVYGFIPGMDAASQINLHNLAFHQIVVVGKLRSGGNYYLIGSDVSGLDLNYNTTTGQGAAGTPGTKLSCTGESIDKALILTSFAPANTLFPPSSTGGSTSGGTSGGGTTSALPQVESLSFINVNSIIVPYTSARRNRFGDFPSIEVWLFDSATNKYYRSTSAEILVDAAPPNQTTFTIKPGNNATGFIILSN